MKNNFKNATLVFSILVCTSFLCAEDKLPKPASLQMEHTIAIEDLQEKIRSVIGEKGLQNKFKGLGNTDPNINGISEVVNKIANTNNLSGVKGASRVLNYVNDIGQSNAFQVKSVELYVKSINGVTTLTNELKGPLISDIDIYLIHNESGVEIWVESKDMKKGDERVHRQIKRQALAAREKGMTYLILSRNKLDLETKKIADRFGAIVYDNVRTGSKNLLPEHRSVASVLVELNHYLNGGELEQTRIEKTYKGFEQNARRNIAETHGVRTSGVMSGGVGGYFLYHQARATWASIGQLSVNSESLHNWLVVSQGASMTASLSGFVVADSGTIFKSMSKFSSVAKKTGWIGMGIYEVASIGDWYTGGMSNQEFTKNQITFGASVASSVIGAWVGGIIGGAISIPAGGTGALPGAVIGATIFGFGGGYFTGLAVENWYDKLNAQQIQKVEDFVERHYR